jgi:hypothetical protein
METEKKINKLKLGKLLTFESTDFLNVDDLMKVEGGVDNDNDWCWIQECSTNASGGSCYTGS